MKQNKINNLSSEFSFSRYLVIIIILIAIFGLMYLRRVTIERFEELHGSDNSNNFSIEINKDGSQIEKLWEHQFPSGKVVAFWTHKSYPDQEYYPMGHTITIGDNLVNEDQLQEKESLTMLATNGKHPLGYQRVWNSKEMNPQPKQDLSIWKPIPPRGYAVLGYVVHNELENEPPTNLITCVPKNCVTKTKIKENIFQYTPRNQKHFSVWNVGNHNFFLADRSIDKPNEKKIKVYNIIDTCLESSQQADPNETAKSVTLHI